MKSAMVYLVCFLLLPLAVALGDEMTESNVSGLGVAVDFLLLGAGLICFSTCLKIFGLLKGGELSSGWQILAVSFIMFSLGQLLSISIDLEFVSLHHSAASVMHLLALGLVIMGVTKIKKSLT